VSRVVIDQERLERPEEDSGRIPRPTRRLARFAQRAANLLEQHFPARELVAARESSLELKNKQRQSPPGQLSEVGSQSFGQPRHRAPARIE
jgi:hypothetical protein